MTPALPSARAETLGLSRAALNRIAASLEPFVDSGKVSGVYVVIARHGRIGYERTFGWMDVARREPLRRDAIFRIYSMTKPVIAVGILRLVEDGRLGLDDPVSKYIPAFANVRVFDGGSADAPILKDPASPITVRQLLNHTSGLAYGLTTGPVDTIFTRAQLYDASRTLEQFTDSLARIPLLFSPGTRWSYSSGLDVAGRVIEVASGRSLDRFLDEQIFRPLGMRDTGFRIRPQMRARLATVYRPGPGGALEELGTDGLMAMFEPEARFFWGSGGLLSTPDDYLRFAQMLLNGGILEGSRILRPETVALMTRNTLPPELTPVSYSALSDTTWGFGLAVAVKVDTVGTGRRGPVGIFRWSGYLGTYFWVDPANDLIAMIWTQLSPGGTYPLDAMFQELVYSALVASSAGRDAGSDHRDATALDTSGLPPFNRNALRSVGSRGRGGRAHSLQDPTAPGDGRPFAGVANENATAHIARASDLTRRAPICCDSRFSIRGAFPNRRCRRPCSSYAGARREQSASERTPRQSQPS